MTAREFRVIHISSGLPSRMKEIAADLKRLHAKHGVTDVAFMACLHPEGAAPDDVKAKLLKERFLEMRDALRGSGLKVGILLQSTLGHGVFTEAPFQRSVNAKGWSGDNMCPLDERLRSYLRRAVEIVASAKPEFFLVDDDFRLANGGAAGCYCKLHLAALEKATGRKFDRESLLSALASDEALEKAWDKVRKESLLGLAREIRSAIDSVSPDIPCGFCVCDAGGMELQWAREIEGVLAGSNPQFVRVGNAWYWCGDPKTLLQRVYWTSAQLKELKGIPTILAESDTYPQNRYYTSAKCLNSQIVYSLLHGCNGLKLWIRRLYEFQPGSGAAYDEVLRKSLGLFRALNDLTPSVSWRGPSVPLPSELSRTPAASSPARSGNWLCSCLGRMGIPAVVGGDGPVFMLSGDECDLFSDAQVKGFLSKGLLLDGKAALKLHQRGFGKLLGVDVSSPEGWRCDFERFDDAPENEGSAGKRIIIAALSRGAAVRLTPRDGATRVLSTLLKTPFYLSDDEEEVGAGLTLFENALGGRVAVYAAALGMTPFMDEIRREQLVRVLGWLERAPLPLVVVSDVDVYALRGSIAKEAGGGELLALFNLNLDALPKLRLRFGGEVPKTISRLSSKGEWKPLKWRLEGSEALVSVKLECAEPLVLRIGERAVSGAS